MVRFLDNCHWKLFYDGNDNYEIFSTKEKIKNSRPYHQIMKFCDTRIRFVLTGQKKYIENKMYKLFYGLPEIPDHFVSPPSCETWCTTLLHEREKYYNIKNINRLNNTQQYINNNPTKSDK